MNTETHEAGIKVSIITVSFNSESTIESCISSVIDQDYPNIEHIIIDGASTDGTMDVVKNHAKHIATYVSEPDSGIYDAMNKGFAKSTGDVVAFLNSDDFYASNDVISAVADAFQSRSNIGFVYGDIEMVRDDKLVRYWKVGKRCQRSVYGRQIPHPSFFVRRSVLSSLETCFDSSYRISADLKQQLILIDKNGTQGHYLEKLITCMRIGGESTSSINAYIKGWKESTKAYNDTFTNGGIAFTILKVASKLPQLIFRS